MGRVIAVANQKGGVGKTTTTINLAAAIGEKNKKVLLIDIDPQGNSTRGLGVDKQKLESTIYHMLLGEATFKEVVIRKQFKNLDIIPANVNLAGAEVELIPLENSSFVLRNLLEEIREQYDFVFIDCPPSLSILTLNALSAADTVLVPIQCEFFALEGLSQLMYTINLVRKRLNPKLIIEGIVFTMFDSRTNLSIQVVEEVKRELIHTNIYQTIIPRNIRLSEAPSYGLPINQYDDKSKGAKSYEMLAQEVIERNNEQW